MQLSLRTGSDQLGKSVLQSQSWDLVSAEIKTIGAVDHMKFRLPSQNRLKAHCYR